MSVFSFRNYVGCLIFGFLAFFSLQGTWSMVAWFLSFLPETYIQVGKFTLVILSLAGGAMIFFVFLCLAILFLVMDL